MIYNFKSISEYIICDIKKLETTHMPTDREIITKWRLENILLLIAVSLGSGTEEVGGEKNRQHLS